MATTGVHSAVETGVKGDFVARALGNLAYRLERLTERMQKATYRRLMNVKGLITVRKIKTWTTFRELRALYQIASACPVGTKALEIGSYLGASSCYIAAGLAQVQGNLICVDTWQNDTIPGGQVDTYAEFTKNTAVVKSHIQMLRKRSDELTLADLPSTLHFVFLDGDHSYQAVHAEFALISPLVAENGVVAFHDAVVWEGVSRTIGEALATGNWMFGGNVDNLTWLKKTVVGNPDYNVPGADD